MAAPRGKGIYTLGPQLYPDSDPAGYAKRLGCSFVALLNGRHVGEHAERAKRLGLATYLYNTPESWHPDNYADTFSRTMDRVERYRLTGFIADVEDAPSWIGYDDDVVSLSEALNYAAKHWSVGFTSFPSWPYVEEVARRTRQNSVWGTPQLYGIIDPAPNDVLANRGESWRNAFGDANFIPSLAAWNRSANAQANYLGYFNNEFGALLWLSQATPTEGRPLYNVLQSWEPRGRRPLDVRQLFSSFVDHVTRPIPRLFT